MGLFDRFKKETPKKEEVSESICKYYNNGKCNVDPSYPCSYKNPSDYINCPVYRYNALGDVSAIF